MSPPAREARGANEPQLEDVMAAPAVKEVVAAPGEGAVGSENGWLPGGLGAGGWG